MRKVFVAMSGGVDSSVAAALLKEQGFDVVGVFMRCYSGELTKGCTWEDDLKSVFSVASVLKIPLEVWDFEKEYREKVIDYMVSEYAVGRTPNPDIACNKEIKFGLFYDRAIKRWADFIATGHYIRKSVDNKLLKAKDENKDQSYFLYNLTPEKIARCLFPIGEYRKSETRELARKFGLPCWNRKDSQGICFLGKISISDFLKDELGIKEGLIISDKGGILGKHQGIYLYTTGQRKGIGIAAQAPLYISEKDVENNIIKVAEGRENPSLYSNKIEVENCHWLYKPNLPLTCDVKIRYRQPDQKVLAVSDGNGKLILEFEKPQFAPASGQSVVFYRGEEVLGGGIIAG